MFWSIISDYHLKTGLCELIDNAIDLWTLSTPKGKLAIAITLYADRQFIAVHDDAGGIKEGELNLLIAPRGSKNDPLATVIGTHELAEGDAIYFDPSVSHAYRGLGAGPTTALVVQLPKA